METYDVIVAGLGGMGSAAAYHLAARGQRVLGIEQHTPAHSRGSSHGRSRIIRTAYFEHPAYVPLLLHSYDLWRQLEHDSGRQLLTITGGLMIGPAESAVVSGSLRSAQQHNLPHELLDASALRRRYPPFTPAADVVALYEQHAGFLDPEECVRAHLDRAGAHGATLRFEEPIHSWSVAASGVGVHVTTTRGTYAAERLVITPGPWAPALLAGLDLPLVVERQVLYWFEPYGGVEPFLPDRFPIYIWEVTPGLMLYGFPAQPGPPGGVKTAFYRTEPRQPCTPDSIDRAVHQHEVDHIRGWLARCIPSLNGAFREGLTCMYTNTPDEHFVIGIHPRYPQVALAAGFSGHGFKFASVVGAILADLAIDRVTRHPIDLFAPTRFTTP